MNAGFEQTIAAARRDLLMTAARVRGSPPLPISMMEDIKRVPGITDVAPRAYFVGIYRPPYDVAAIATEPAAFFKLRPRLTVAAEYIEAMRTTRTGLLATPALLKNYDLEVGDQITLLFLTGNALRQSVHERLPEFAVLKAVGYSDTKVCVIALGEALALYLAGALVGLALAAAVAPFAPEIAGSIRVSRDVLVRAIGLAMLFAAASIALPGLRLYRLSVAGALANR